MGVRERWLVPAAWALVALSLAATATTGVILAASQPPGRVVAHLAMDVSILAFVVVGILIVRRRPHQLVGWLCLGLGTFFTLSLLSQVYADHTLLHDPGSLPGGPWLVLLGNWLMEPAIVLGIVLLPALFPTGTPASPRWRWVVRAGLGLLPLLVVTAPFVEDELRVWPPDATEPVVVGTNPFLTVPGAGVLQVVGTAAFMAIFLLMPFAVASLIGRFRRATGVERQQLRWFRASLCLVAALVASLFLLAVLPFEVSDDVLDPIFAVAVTAVPVSIGVAVSRYRLYDIDRVVSRTLAYAVVTAVLLALYVGTTLALGSAFRVVTGEEGSDLVVAASTLLVAAAFGPVRRRVQAVVDRRFHRAGYDASRTVAAFGQQLRDEVDLETIGAELRLVATRTVHPARCGLWLASRP